MKIRNGFVSNSSSSSFICQICNHTETGWDSNYDELGFDMCENGHMFCESHTLETNDQSKNDDGELLEQYCPICTYQELSYKDIKQYFLKTTSITIEQVFEEIKKINKRRRKVYDNEYVEYVMKENGLTSDNLLATLKETYPKYNDFINSI